MRSFLLFAFLLCSVSAWQLPTRPSSSSRASFASSTTAVQRPSQHTALFATETKENTSTTNPEDTTEKYGLEAGLFESMKQKDGGESAKSLLKKYGIAYLATSIPLAIVSFAICYVLVDNGVNVAGLLENIGINNAATEKAGTFAIAYAAHKAASPIRFPPTVLLTPVVAKLIGKEVDESEDDASGSEGSS